MLLLPAIDLKDGQCVRLYKGDMRAVTVYGNDPKEMALRWQQEGAKYLHLVDLDGAVAGSPKNRTAIEEIIRNVNIPAQLGGGIREMATIALYFELGLTRVIIGTAAVKNPSFVEEAVKKYGSDRIVLGLDSKAGQVAVDGWEKTANKSALDFAMEMKEIGITTMVYTDTLRDGTLEGINLDGLREMAEITGMRVIASGGVASIHDVINVKEMVKYGVEGLILGKALYSGTLDLKEALAVAK